MKILLVAVLCLISALTLLSQARPRREMTDLGDLTGSNLPFDSVSRLADAPVWGRIIVYMLYE